MRSFPQRTLPIRFVPVLLAISAAPPCPLPARAQAERAMHVHELQVRGQWGADLSPDGRTVAVCILRRASVGADQVFVDAEVWDVRAKKMLAKRTLSHRVNFTVTTAEWGQVRYTSDGQVLLIYDGELLHVVKAGNLDEIARIDLGLPSLPREAEVVGLVVPRNFNRWAAVLVSRGLGKGGSARVYDLQTGHLVRIWEIEKGYPEYGARMAWSPDGKRLAISLLPFLPGQRKLTKDDKNLEVVDVASGKILEQLNTGYLAGPVAYAGDSKLLTATAEMAWMLPAGSHSIKVWDLATGRMLRQIQAPPMGVRGSLEVSADGHRVLGYIGAEESAGPVGDPESSFDIFEQRFRIWALPSGRVLATSPALPKASKRAQLRTSAKGNAVLVYWKYPDNPILIYEVP